MIKNCFKNKTVLVTGHTGFKGSWLISWLNQIGANIIGVALDPPSEISHFSVAKMSKNIRDLRVDIRDFESFNKIIVETQPDFVFHLAAQALVRSSYESPIETWQTNVIGTLHILEALRNMNKPCVAVLITSDKCYDNVEWVWGYRENDAMGGPDPYSASKGAAELAIRSHIKSFFPKGETQVRIASARAGNVIGGGDWAVDRIVPDCVKAWSQKQTVILRNPHSTRPWQHVLEPLGGYLTLAAALFERPELHGESFNFGPPSDQTQSVLELVQQMSKSWDQVRWEDIVNDNTGPYESGLLKLNCDKALHYLKWQASLNFDETVKLTADWYKSYYKKSDSISDITTDQIKKYMKHSNIFFD
jgi:CDP-glucose 4,6-dehydratase